MHETFIILKVWEKEPNLDHLYVDIRIKMELSKCFDYVEWINLAQNTGYVECCNKVFYSTKELGNATPYHEVFTCKGWKNRNGNLFLR